jgi:hypothetical protein
MEWSVVKIGVAQFDMLHAYGLGILLATASGEPVELRDAGCLYQLSCSAPQIARLSCSVLLERVLPLPGEEDVLDCDPRAEEPKLAVAVFDGLLAALFTIPGPRVLSVSDLLWRQHLDEKALQRGLHKVARQIRKWKALARRAAGEKEADWLSDVLSDYGRAHPASPTLVKGKAERDINLYIPIDPAFGYSLRSVRSHGRMTEKTQVTLRGTRYGALLAFIGAARFLRGQRLTGTLINCYVPLARKLIISAQSALPLLLPADERPDQAAVRRWLALSEEASLIGAAWSGLTYQTLLTQGQQQSLSVESGLLECGWVVALQERLGRGVVAFWRSLLAPGAAALDEQEPLVDCLKRRDPGGWVTHLHAYSQRLQGRTESEGRRYHLEEVRRITEVMHDSERIPLRRALEREQGTLCFGRALRQIGRANPARLRDLLEDLEEARTHAQLLPVLHRIVAASEIEKAKKRWIIVPSEDDLAALLEDIEQFGIPVLVGLLQVLSSLRSPRSDNAQKYELSTLMRALIALAIHIGVIEIDESDPSPASHELFLDDPGLSGVPSAEDEELE